MPKIQPTETPRSKTDIDSGASHSATSRAQTLLAILRNKTGGRGVHWESNKSGNAGGSEQGSPRGEGAGLSGAAAPVVVDVEDTPMTKREGSVQQESREQEANVWGSSCSTDGEMSKPNVNRRAKEISSFPITGLQSGIPLSKLKIVIGESSPLHFPTFCLFGAFKLCYVFPASSLIMMKFSWHNRFGKCDHNFSCFLLVRMEKLSCTHRYFFHIVVDKPGSGPISSSARVLFHIKSWSRLTPFCVATSLLG